MSSSSSTISALRAGLGASRRPSTSSSRSASTSTFWPSKTHLKPSPTIPAPVPALYPQCIVLSDGSTFTSFTTAPTPAIIRLTRDVTNNPLWAPGTEKRGLGDGVEEGRVGRFRRRFEGVGAGAVAQSERAAFGEKDFDWMSEGAKAEVVSQKEMQGKPKATGKKK